MSAPIDPATGMPMVGPPKPAPPMMGPPRPPVGPPRPDPTLQGQSGYGSPYAQPPPTDPRLIEAMLGTFGEQLELSQLEKQAEQARALRNAPGPEGRDSGRLYTAAHPLEHIGAGIQKYREGKKVKEAEEAAAKKRTTIGTNVKEYGKNIPK